MSITYTLRRVLFVGLILSALFPFFDIHAQSKAAAGIGLTPAVTEGNAIPGEVQNHSFQVTNLSSTRQTYYIYKKDITGVNEGGVPVFAEEGLEKTGYELTEWVSLDTEQIDLNAGEEKQINVVITVPQDATPCSHFGAIIISMQPPRLRSTGAAVGYEVAHPISLNVAGDCILNAQIRSFSTGNFIYSKPVIDFKARVENKGNVLLRPFGPIEVSNMFGKRVAMLTLNETKAGIFPLTTRDFDLTWEHDGPGFGRYEAILSLVYGDDERRSTVTSTASFWILPMNIILPALGVLVFLLLFTYITVKLYISRSIRRVSGESRRIVRRRRQSGMSALLLVVVVMLAVTALFLLALLALFA